MNEYKLRRVKVELVEEVWSVTDLDSAESVFQGELDGMNAEDVFSYLPGRMRRDEGNSYLVHLSVEEFSEDSLDMHPFWGDNAYRLATSNEWAIGVERAAKRLYLHIDVPELGSDVLSQNPEIRLQASRSKYPVIDLQAGPSMLFTNEKSVPWSYVATNFLRELAGWPQPEGDSEEACVTTDRTKQILVADILAAYSDTNGLVEVDLVPWGKVSESNVQSILNVFAESAEAWSEAYGEPLQLKFVTDTAHEMAARARQATKVAEATASQVQAAVLGQTSTGQATSNRR